MTKGEAYRAYYLAHRDRILEANRERQRLARERRRALDDTAKDKLRQKAREAYYDRRAKHARSAFKEKAESVEGEWKAFYNCLADLPDTQLANLTKTITDFLMTASPQT